MSYEQNLFSFSNQSNWRFYSVEAELAHSQSEAGHNGLTVYSTQQMPEVTPDSKSGTYTLDRDLLKACRVIFRGYVVLAFCVFGLLGNCLTILVLKRDPNKESTTVWLLKALACIDNSFLISALLFIASSAIWEKYWINKMSVTLYSLMQLVFRPIASVTQSLTIWIVIHVTIDRYLAICKPLNSSWRNLCRMKITALMLFILVVLFRTPSIFGELITMHYRRCLSNYTNRSSAENSSCYKQYSNMFTGLEIYNISSYLIFFSIGPLIIIIILNLRMAWALRTLKKKRWQMMQQIKTESNIAMMLVLVVVVFIFCQVPSAILQFVQIHRNSHWPRLNVNPKVLYCAFQISTALRVLNSSVNFLMYCLISRRFNRTLCRMFTCRKRKRRQTVMIAYTAPLYDVHKASGEVFI